VGIFILEEFLLELDGPSRPVHHWAMPSQPRHAKDDIELVIQIQHDELVIEL
jgi:hypothetical protein